MWSSPTSTQWHRFYSSLFAASLVFLLGFFPAPVYQTIEHNLYDLLLKTAPKVHYEPRIILVDVDERSLAQVGAWPWSREVIAKLIDTLVTKYRVVLLGIDMVFPESKTGDLQLRESLSQPNVVLAQVFDFSEEGAYQVGELLSGHGLGCQSESAHWPQARGYIGNNAGVLGHSPLIGHISPKLGEDGKIRHLYPVICFEGKCTLSLGLELLRNLFSGQTAWAPGASMFEVPRLLLSVGGPSIPVDEEFSSLIPYRVSSGGFEYVSAVDVLTGHVAEAKLKNSVVIFGGTALSIGDRVTTPQGIQRPGLEIHAQVFSAGMDGAFINQLSFLGKVTLFGLCVSFMSILLLQWGWLISNGRVFLFSGFAVITYSLAVMLVFSEWSLLLPLASIPIYLFLVGIFSSLIDMLCMNQRLARIALESSHFLPEMLVRKLLNEQTVSVKTERKCLSVLVTDMRGFTKASEGKSPEKVAQLAQKCLETLSGVVSDYEGIVEKYTGDGLMAIWGAEETVSGVAVSPPVLAARSALQAAIEMQRVISDLEGWFVENGFEPMRVSVGINSGEMAVGIFGGAHRAWSAHGDAVNLATRIEQLTRQTGYDLLVGRSTAELVGIEYFMSLGVHPVKGRNELVEIFTLNNQIKLN